MERTKLYQQQARGNNAYNRNMNMRAGQMQQEDPFLSAYNNYEQGDQLRKTWDFFANKTSDGMYQGHKVAKLDGITDKQMYERFGEAVDPKAYTKEMWNAGVNPYDAKAIENFNAQKIGSVASNVNPAINMTEAEAQSVLGNNPFVNVAQGAQNTANTGAALLNNPASLTQAVNAGTNAANVGNIALNSAMTEAEAQALASTMATDTATVGSINLAADTAAAEAAAAAAAEGTAAGTVGAEAAAAEAAAAGAGGIGTLGIGLGAFGLAKLFGLF